MSEKQKSKNCKPKRAMNAYFIFIKEMRQNDETKGLKLPEFVKFCANRWKELTESQKNQYKIKAAADKQRYADQKKKYQSMVPKIVKRPM